MRFKVTIEALENHVILPANYQYPLSTIIYRIISKGDQEYAKFLHERGYGKGFKLFTFSQLNTPFEINGDRLRLKGNVANFQIGFHLPQAMESFVKGLFQSENIVIADKNSKGHFVVKSVESLSNPLLQYKENEIIHINTKPLSPIVGGLMKADGKYDFLSPDDPQFVDSLIYNWRSKIETCYDPETASAALLMMEVVPMKQNFKSRLITIKAQTPAETKIRGWMDFELKVTGERRFVELLMNAGAGVYNAQGMGCLEVVEEKTGVKIKAIVF